MKKSIIATGAASLALAAMPVVGAFAQTLTFEDDVVVTVSAGCSFEVTDDQAAVTDLDSPRIFEADAELGEVVILGGTAQAGATNEQNITVACNTTDATKSWTVTAVGAQASGDENKMLPLVTANAKIATSGDEVTSGGTSYWAFKIEGGSAAGNYGSWSAVPGTTAVTVATGAANAATDASFAPAYRVYIGTNQQADTYTGKVAYTLSDTL